MVEDYFKLVSFVGSYIDAFLAALPTEIGHLAAGVILGLIDVIASSIERKSSVFHMAY